MALVGVVFFKNRTRARKWPAIYGVQATNRRSRNSTA
jgi:hypothetical protein